MLVNEYAGLYVTAETNVVNDVVFKTLLDGADNLQLMNDDNDVGEGEGEAKQKSFAAAANVAKKTVDDLLRRASNPTRDMKKRAK